MLNINKPEVIFRTNKQTFLSVLYSAPGEENITSELLYKLDYLYA
jgi:hypothetical protein